MNDTVSQARCGILHAASQNRDRHDHTTVILRSVPSWARVSKDGHTQFVSTLRDAAQARDSSG
jgi:hypothetical protein